MGLAHDSAVLARIHARLESEMSRVRDEIRHYPAPIPACDAQFNHLLESREALSTALVRLGELIGRNEGNYDGESIDALLDPSHDLDESVMSEIRTIIQKESRKLEGGQ